MKRCADCGAVKPLDAFHREARRPDGRDCYCRECRRERAKSPSIKAGKKAWEQRNQVQRNAYKRRWERDRADPCVNCGVPLSDPRSTSCPDCRNASLHAQAYERTARWLELRRSGLGNNEIAEREGTTAPSVAGLLQRRRVARFPDLEWLPAPYAAKRGVAA